MPAHPILELQSTLGNQAVQRMLRTGMIQTKPKTVSPAIDMSRKPTAWPSR